MLRMRISCKHGKANLPSVQGENEMIRKTAFWLVVVYDYHYRLGGFFAFSANIFNFANISSPMHVPISSKKSSSIFQKHSFLT